MTPLAHLELATSNTACMHLLVHFAIEVCHAQTVHTRGTLTSDLQQQVESLRYDLTSSGQEHS